jgi:hypothetical protein
MRQTAKRDLGTRVGQVTVLRRVSPQLARGLTPALASVLREVWLARC